MSDDVVGAVGGAESEAAVSGVPGVPAGAAAPAGEAPAATAGASDPLVELERLAGEVGHVAAGAAGGDGPLGRDLDDFVQHVALHRPEVVDGLGANVMGQLEVVRSVAADLPAGLLEAAQEVGLADLPAAWKALAGMASTPREASSEHALAELESTAPEHVAGFAAAVKESYPQVAAELGDAEIRAARAGLARLGREMPALLDAIDDQALDILPSTWRALAAYGRSRAGARPVARQQAPAHGEASAAAIQRAMRDPRYWADPAFNRRVGEAMAKIHGPGARIGPGGGVAIGPGGQVRTL